MDSTDRSQLEMLEAERGAGAALRHWHFHIPQKIVTAMRASPSLVLAFMDRCESVSVAFLREAARCEEAGTVCSDGLTADENMTHALYFDALRVVCERWLDANTK